MMATVTISSSWLKGKHLCPDKGRQETACQLHIDMLFLQVNHGILNCSTKLGQLLSLITPYSAGYCPGIHRFYFALQAS